MKTKIEFKTNDSSKARTWLRAHGLQYTPFGWRSCDQDGYLSDDVGYVIFDQKENVYKAVYCPAQSITIH